MRGGTVTINPIEIEGSPERAADRGSDMMPLPANMDGPTYLGEMPVAEAELRAWLGKIVDIRKRYHDDLATSASAFQEVVESTSEEAKRWTAPGALDFNLAATLADTGINEPVTFFLAIALRLIMAMAAHEDSGDDEAAKFAINTCVDDAMAAIFGTERSGGKGEVIA